jgi:type I restriction enzyme S subunit
LKAFVIIPKEYDNQICSTGFAVLSCQKDILPHYLLYTLFSKTIIDQCNRMMIGGQYPALNQSQVAKIKIPLPPLPEQRAIAQILSTVDDAIQKVDNAIAKTEQLKKGTMQELLTKGIGHTKFKDTKIGRIPEEWEEVKLGDDTTADLIMGQSPPSSKYNRKGVGLPFFQGNAEFGDIYPEPVLYCSEPIKIAEKDDIFLSVRAPVGDINIAPFQSCIGRGLAAIRSKSDKLDYLFLFYYLKYGSKSFESLSMGSTFKAIRKVEVEKFKIPLPPLPEQRKIAEILTTIDKKLELERKRKQKLERIKQGLMNDLLTGKKRVVM